MENESRHGQGAGPRRLAGSLRYARPAAVATRASPKQAVSLRLSPDVLAYYKAKGKGWQAIVNETLAKAMKPPGAAAKTARSDIQR